MRRGTPSKKKANRAPTPAFAGAGLREGPKTSSAKKRAAKKTASKKKANRAPTVREGPKKSSAKKRVAKKTASKIKRSRTPTGREGSKTSSKKTKTAAVRRTKAPGAILITGATGFLGKHLIDLLAQQRDDAPSRRRPRLRALVRNPSLHLERRGVDCVVGDVCDEAACERALVGVDRVFHLAGFVSRK